MKKAKGLYSEGTKKGSENYTFPLDITLIFAGHKKHLPI
jgi:hypothetical protein